MDETQKTSPLERDIGETGSKQHGEEGGEPEFRRAPDEGAKPLGSMIKVEKPRYEQIWVWLPLKMLESMKMLVKMGIYFNIASLMRNAVRAFVDRKVLRSPVVIWTDKLFPPDDSKNVGVGVPRFYARRLRKLAARFGTGYVGKVTRLAIEIYLVNEFLRSLFGLFGGGRVKVTSAYKILERALKSNERAKILCALGMMGGLDCLELTEIINLSYHDMRHNLNVLEEAGLVQKRNFGGRQFYKLSETQLPEKFQQKLREAVRKFQDSNLCHWE